MAHELAVCLKTVNKPTEMNATVTKQVITP